MTNTTKKPATTATPSTAPAPDTVEFRILNDGSLAMAAARTGNEYPNPYLSPSSPDA